MSARRLGGIAALIAGITALSRVGGFLREAVIAGVFGASAGVDSYLVAQSIPNVIIALLSTAVVTSMLPALTEDVARGERPAADRTFSTVGTVVILALVPATVLLIIAAPAVVRLLAPGFPAEQVVLTVRLARIVLLATLLVAATNLLTAMLHAHRRHVWPSLEGLPFNAVMIGAALVLGPVLGVEALAIGFVVGSGARLVLQVAGLRGTRVRLAPRLDWSEPGVRRAFGLLPTVLLSHTVSNVNHIVDRVVASTLRAGSIAALGFGHRLVTLPHGLLSQALIQVLYPSLSARIATEGAQAGARLLRRGTVMLTLVLAPIALLLTVESATIVSVVYGRGRFGAQDVTLTAAALAAFAPGLVFAGVRDVALRGLYAVNDRRMPVIAALAGAAANIAGDVTLGPLLGVTGLALATSGSQAVSCVAALRGLARDRGGLRLRGLVRSLAPVAGAATLAAVAMIGVGQWWPAATSTVAGLVRLGAVGAAGVAVHLVTLHLLGVPELTELRGLVSLRGRYRRP